MMSNTTPEDPENQANEPENQPEQPEVPQAPQFAQEQVGEPHVQQPQDAPIPPQGAPVFEQAPAGEYGQAPSAYPQAPGAYPQGYAMAPAQPKGLSIASLVCGIASVVLSLVVYLGFPLAVAAVVLGFIGKSKGQQKGFWLTGLILGFVGAAIGIIMIISIIVFFVQLGSMDYDIP
jgi:hypothetical protein